MTEHKVPEKLVDCRLDAVVRQLHQCSWGQARRWIERGKVFVDGTAELDASRTVGSGSTIELRPLAPRPRTVESVTDSMVLHLDRDLIVLCKPPGVSTVPFEPGERGTFIDGVRRYLSARFRGTPTKGKRHGALPPVYVVQRLDRGTTGVIVFARTRAAERGLREQFRHHVVLRRYTALVHGQLRDGTYRSHLLKDRGDGLRGSREAAHPGMNRRRFGEKVGKLSITHVKVLEKYDNPAASLVECRLETGRTNQIRIHLSEAGHPLLGEKLYLRDFRGPLIDAPRLLLHAGVLGFQHPIDKQKLLFDIPLPDDMRRMILHLKRTH